RSPRRCFAICPRRTSASCSAWWSPSWVPCRSVARAVADATARLRFDDAAVAAAEVAPVHVEGRVVGDGELRGQLLVQVDAQAGLVVGPVVAVLQGRAAGEDLLLRRGELARLLDAEVGGGQVEVDVGGVADRRDVPRTVPRGADGKEFAE